MSFLGNTIAKNKVTVNKLYCVTINADELEITGDGYIMDKFDESFNYGSMTVPIKYTSNAFDTISSTLQVVNTTSVSAQSSAEPPSGVTSLCSWSQQYASGWWLNFSYSGSSFRFISCGNGSTSFNDNIYSTSDIYYKYTSDNVYIVGFCVYSTNDTTNTIGHYNTSTKTVTIVHTDVGYNAPVLIYRMHNNSYGDVYKLKFSSYTHSGGCPEVVFVNTSNNAITLGKQSQHLWMSTFETDTIMSKKTLNPNESVTLVRVGNYWYINNGYY